MNSATGQASSPSACGPLNPFQEAMLIWEDSHPYNGAHVVRLEGPPDVAAWQRAVEWAARRAGLGLLTIDRARGSYSLEPAGRIEVRAVERGASPVREALWRSVRTDMGCPFPSGPHHPVRWSITGDPESGCHYLTAVYRHVAADGASMGAIIADAIGAYLGLGPRDDDASVLAAGAGAPRAARRGRLRSLARATRLFFRMRRAHRMRLRKDAGEDTDFIVLEAPRDLLGRLATALASRGATVNDAFLTALASAIASSTPGRRSHPRRRSLALGFVADLRADQGGSGRPTLGVRVGQSVIVVDEPDEPRLESLLERIATLTRAEKERRSFAGTPWSFIALSRLERWLPRQGARSWYRKVYPMAAGLSNVRWRGGSFGGKEGRVLAYYRVPPPGPALPLVVAPTTLDDCLTVSFSYHRGSFTENELKPIASEFLAKLESLAGP